jgi:competence protein ComEA
VGGAVVNPGIYEIPRGSRWQDAIESAGGLSSQANISKINLAQKTKDGEKIVVPSINDGDIFEGSTSLTVDTETLLTQITPIDINVCSQEQLELLPGIGPTKAGNIIDYRERYGPFLNIESLIKVPGIGDELFNQIREYIVVD